MDLDALIAAAKEIDRRAQLQEQRSKRWQELAAMARRVEPESQAHKQIQHESRELSRTVVDFGNPIVALRLALKARGKRKGDSRTIQALKKALLRAATDPGHKYECSAARGMESDCTCGWLEVRKLVKRISGSASCNWRIKMTSPARERLYQAQHMAEHEGRRWLVHNPQDKPIEELPVIYGFNNGGSPGWYSAVAMAEDGTVLGGHCCSHECYMEADLGVIEGWRMDRHEGYRKHYPDGYRMEFVGFNDVRGHEKLMAAIKLCEANPTPEQDNGS